MDKILHCRDCGQSFVFTTGEQEFYASRGFANDPSRCPGCRSARKAGRGYEGRGGRSGDYPRQRREMFPATCARCGKETQVPFMPRGERPVYCSDCFERQRAYR